MAKCEGEKKHTGVMESIGETKAFRDRNLILKGADLATQRGWTGVPNFILESKAISVGAKLTYAMLLKYAREVDRCFPGQVRLGQSKQAVRAAAGKKAVLHRAVAVKQEAAVKAAADKEASQSPS